MKKRVLAFVSLILIAALAFAGCGSKVSDSEYYGGVPDMAPMAPTTNYSSDMEMAKPESSMMYDAAGGVTNITSDPGKISDGLKIIYNAYLSIQTETWDESYSRLNELMTTNDGYLQNSNVSGGYTSDDGYYYDRNANLTIRIPAKNYRAFLTAADSVGTVTNLTENSDDITSTYIDTEARLNTLKAQETRLLELLAKAEAMTDLIEIESKLSDVRYQIESYQSQKNTYDNLLDFTTITIALQEVTTVVTPKDTFGQRISAALKGSGEAIVKFLDNLVIAIIYMGPFLVLGFLIFIVVMLATKKKRQLRKAQIEEYQKNLKTAALKTPYAVPPKDDNDNTQK